MIQDFQNIMFTSLEKRNKQSEEQNKKKQKKIVHGEVNKKAEIFTKLFDNDPTVERIGFIIVFDISETPSFDDAKFLLDKLHSIEKTNNIFYEKCLLANKIYKSIDKKKLKAITSELEIIKKKYKCEYFKISALTSEGLGESFRKFLSKIHQKKIDEKQNEGIDEEQDMELEDDDITWRDKCQSCGTRMFCGSNIFSCVRRNEEEEN